MTFLLWLILLLSGVMILFWLFEWLIGFGGSELEDALEETLRSTEVESMIQQLDQPVPPTFTPSEIRIKVGVIWYETRVLALASNSLLASFYLLVLGLVSLAIVIKSYLFPNIEDLRILLGGEMFVLCQVRPKTK